MEIMCGGCGVKVEQPKRPQGGGTAKLFCSPKCRSRTWARANAAKVAKTQKEYQDQPHVRQYRGDQQRWRRNQPGFKLTQRLSKYGLTVDEFENMLSRQQYKCLGCKRFISNESQEWGERAVIDHCHESNKVRGLLCDSCNTVLGQVQEDKGTLRRLMAYLSYDRTKTHVYLVGALKNPDIPQLAKTLREEGYEVFAEWHNAGPRADMHWQDHEKFKGSSYKEALAGPHVENVFYYDQAYIDLADIVVLVMPAGKSGHLELGYAAGGGKKTIILLDEEPARYDIMPRFADTICNNVSELIEELGKLCPAK